MAPPHLHTPTPPYSVPPAGWRVLLPAGGQGQERRPRIAFAIFVGGKEWNQAREVISCPDGTVLVGAQVMSDDT